MTATWNGVLSSALGQYQQLSNRQLALLAAVNSCRVGPPDKMLEIADQYLAWLESGD